MVIGAPGLTRATPQVTSVVRTIPDIDVFLKDQLNLFTCHRPFALNITLHGIWLEILFRIPWGTVIWNGHGPACQSKLFLELGVNRLTKPVKKGGKEFRPLAGNMRLRPDRIDEHPHSITQRYRAEYQSQIAANEAGKMSDGSRHTHAQGQNKQDTSRQSCRDDGLPPQMPRKMFGRPTVENAIPTEHRH
jgi:hypothetical protein